MDELNDLLNELCADWITATLECDLGIAEVFIYNGNLWVLN